MSLEAFDPQEVQQHPLRSLPESLRFRAPERREPLILAARPKIRLKRTRSFTISHPRPQGWLGAIPDGLVALAVDVLVGSTGGSGSMLASRTELAQVPSSDVPRRTPLKPPLH